MTTRKTLIVAKYGVLELELKKHLDNSIFPSLDTVDLVDIVYYVTIIFTGIESDKGYREKIRELISTDGIDVDATTFDIIAPLIIEFVDWLKKLWDSGDCAPRTPPAKRGRITESENRGDTLTVD